jgi:hypothetical protein
MSKRARFSMGLLFVLVLLSLTLNGLLLWQWWTFQQQTVQTIQKFTPIINDSLSQAITDMQEFEQSTVEFNIQVSQNIPIETEIPFNETLDIPINTTIPIEQQIATTVMIDPLQTGLEIPIDINVPLTMEVPVNMNIPITINRTIPISTSIPFDLTVPISIKISETELAPYLQRLRTALESMAQTLSNIQ